MFDPIIIVIHVFALLLLFLIGLYGGYATRPVLPLPEAWGNWRNGQITWAAFWTLAFYQVVIPYTAGLWLRTEIGDKVLTKGLAVVWWAFVFAVIAGLVIAIRVKQSLGYFFGWGFLAGFVVAFVFYLIVDGFIWGLSVKYAPEMLQIGTIEDLKNLNDPLSLLNAILLVLYPVSVLIGSRKMMIRIAKARKMIK